jgi:low temperature requirement protein LtrA
VTGRSIRGFEEQGATFVELFFDLVFVFAVTQVTGVLVHDLSGRGIVQALIVFWLVWWAWTQFTWSLNEADTEHVTVRLVTLLATALAFMMAVTVPLLEEPIGWLFPLSYLAVRVVGIGLQWRLAGGDPEWAKSVRVWTLGSSVGLLAVSAAVFLAPEYRFLALGIAAFADVGAALRAGRNEWRIYPRHFSERHGLFVIIVLGESLIAAGVSAGGQEIDAAVLTVTITAVAAACALWWTYFGWVKEALEEGLTAQTPAAIGRFARDVYSFAHFPLIFGVVGFAVAIEASVAHPRDTLETPVLASLVVGVSLIVGATAIALLRAGRQVPRVRWMAIIVILASAPLLAVAEAWMALALITAVTAALAFLERPSPHSPNVERPFN